MITTINQLIKHSSSDLMAIMPGRDGWCILYNGKKVPVSKALIHKLSLNGVAFPQVFYTVDMPKLKEKEVMKKKRS